MCVYIVLCLALFFLQEQIIFFPQKLDKNHSFNFNLNFEELSIKTSDGVILNGVLFKTQKAKGLIFYLHGNAGSVATWGNVAKTYNDLGLDVFMPDYRGYGKSDGKIYSESQFYSDMQTAYSLMATKYPETKIIVLGYSIGTGAAANIASVNNPKALILQAPYFSLTDMMQRNYSFIPAFLLKYKFETHRFLKNCKAPVIIFHGDADEVIYYESSLKLSRNFKSGDSLITLKNQRHNNMSENPEYQFQIEQLFKRLLP